MHNVLGAGQAAEAVAQAPPLEVAVLLELAHAGADGVDALAVYAGQALERVVPLLGQAQHLREQPLGL